MGKNSQRTEEIELLCRLTESELEEEAKKLTALIVEKSQQEAEKKAIAADYGDRIKHLEEEIEDQVPIVADRQKRKMVSCLIEYNKPSLGKKTVTRLDLNTVVGVYDMNEDGKQDIFYNSDDEDAIDVPAVKLLPAAEDTWDRRWLIWNRDASTRSKGTSICARRNRTKNAKGVH